MGARRTRLRVALLAIRRLVVDLAAQVVEALAVGTLTHDQPRLYATSARFGALPTAKQTKDGFVFKVTQPEQETRMWSSLPLPNCRRSTEDRAPTRRTAARWAGCGPRSCWRGSRSRPDKRRPAAGSPRHMCWNTAHTHSRESTPSTCMFIFH